MVYIEESAKWNDEKTKSNDCISRSSLLASLNKFAPEKYDALVKDLIMKEPGVDILSKWIPVKNGLPKKVLCFQNLCM